ncbi:MAG TPA: GNAT family N-acetyltransferase [Bryobacteraceae bacterium]|nr:GNAT family N-acetyltransferase [Bryobacteraceae bacterium]
MSDFLIIDENLRAAMRFFGDATGSGEIHELDGAVAMFSGLDYGVFNIALLTRPAAGAELEDRLRAMARFFRERTLRWSVWLCEDMLDLATRRREREIFSNFGLRTISNPPGMIADALLPPVRPLPAIECRRVDDSKTRKAFTELTSLSFDIPYTVAHAVYSRAGAWEGEYKGFVAYAGGKLVAIVAIVAAAGAIGIYSLATLPEFRRRGYGEALLRAAAAQTAAETGLSRLVLQSTEAGYKLYKAMGFRDVTRFSVYLTR